MWPWILIFGARSDCLLASTERPPPEVSTNDSVVRDPSISLVMSRPIALRLRLASMLPR